MKILAKIEADCLKPQWKGTLTELIKGQLALIQELKADLAVINSAKDVFDVVEFPNHEQECFVILLLNSKKELLEQKLIFMGTLDTCLTHPRDVFRHAIRTNAAAVILAHNHPSGDCNPSPVIWRKSQGFGDKLMSKPFC